MLMFVPQQVGRYLSVKYTKNAHSFGFIVVFVQFISSNIFSVPDEHTYMEACRMFQM